MSSPQPPHPPTHDEVRTWAGAYVLGALERSERADFEAHLGTCPTCREEVAGFAPLPSLLAAVDQEPGSDATPAPPPTAAVLPGALAKARSARQRERKRLRMWQGAAAVAALATVASTAFAIGERTATSQPTEALATSNTASTVSPTTAASDPTATTATTATTPAPTPGVSVSLRANTPGAAGTVVLTRKGWGTEIAVDASGLPPRANYHLWAVSQDGTRQIAASWGPTASGRIRCMGAASITTDQLAAIEIGDREGIILRAETA